MRRAWPASLLVVCVCLAGCAVGPDYERPEAATPGGWREDPGETVDSADVVWWGLFEDAVLDGLIDEALRNNYDVRIAAGRVEEFAARVGITRSAAFPQITYDGSLGRQQISRETVSGGAPGSDRVSDFFNANLNVGWELDLWGRIRRATEAARADVLAAEENRRGVILTLVTAVATGYVGLRSLDEQLMIANVTLRSRGETLDLFELQLEKGVISQLEVSQIRSEYERTAAAIPALERDIALLENSLSVLLGRPPGPIDRGSRITVLTPPPIPSGLPSDLLLRRPDLREAEHRLYAANERIGEAVAEYFPRVSLTGILGLASEDLSDLAKNSASVYTAAGGLVGPIFTAGLLRSQVETAEAVERQALDEYFQTVLTSLREAEDALVTRSTTLDEIAAQGRQLEALATYSGLARQRYENGYVGYLEVLDAERDLFDAELERVRLLAGLHASIIGIYKAFGGGWVIEAEAVADEAHAGRRGREP